MARDLSGCRKCLADPGRSCHRARLQKALNERVSPRKKRIEVSVGESVRILRELQDLSQSQLSKLAGIAHATISAIENDRGNLGVERTKVFARALNCHPAVLVLPGREAPLERSA